MSEIFSKVDELKCHQRLKSFCDWRSPVSYIGIAAAGFRYTGQLDRVKCDDCGLRVLEWTNSEDPIEVHVRLSRNCPFLKTIGYNPNIHIPRYVKFSHYSDRLNSMKAVPEKYHASLPSFESIASAGFSYQGTLDRMWCYDCGLILKDWESSTDALYFHRRFRPDCHFVKSIFVLKAGGVPRLQADELFVDLFRHSEVSLTAQIGNLMLQEANLSENRATGDAVSEQPSLQSPPDRTVDNMKNLNEADEALTENALKYTLSRTHGNTIAQTTTGSNMPALTSCRQECSRLEYKNHLEVDCLDEPDGVIDVVDGVFEATVPNACGLAERRHSELRESEAIPDPSSIDGAGDEDGGLDKGCSTNLCPDNDGDKVDKSDEENAWNPCALIEKQSENIIDELDEKNPSKRCDRAQRQSDDKLEDGVEGPDVKKNSDESHVLPLYKMQRASQKKRKNRRRNPKKRTQKNKPVSVDINGLVSNDRHDHNIGSKKSIDVRNGKTSFRKQKKGNFLDAQNALEGSTKTVESFHPETCSCFMQPSLTNQHQSEENESIEGDIMDRACDSSRRAGFRMNTPDNVKNNHEDDSQEAKAVDDSDREMTGSDESSDLFSPISPFSIHSYLKFTRGWGNFFCFR